MKSRKRNKVSYHATHSTEGHDGKAAAVCRKLRRGDFAKLRGHKDVARANRPAMSPNARLRNTGTGAGTSCPH